MDSAAADLQNWLQHFRLSSFRPGQEDVIQAILDGRDTLCIMPTGGGKSLCYQLPTIARDGVTIVISPLIALMKDQVDALSQLEVPATFINSSLDLAEQRERIAGMTEGRYKLVYVAPERVRSVSFMRAVARTGVQLLAVDEAHCISQWGHDFRPDYARLGRFRQRLGNPQTIGLTATATEIVRDDICKVLQLDQPATFISGFARENLSLNVKSPNGNVAKDARLIKFLQERDGAGIIYASTRKNCEHLVELLQHQIDRPLAFYHAGLESDSRRQVQEAFMSGELPIIVATNAFGMGIDKADLRFVVHYNLPGSVEAYYQEAGRAGRDGAPAECLLLYSYQDRFIQEFFIENSYPSREVVKQVYEYLRSFDTDPIEMTLMQIKEDLGLSISSEGVANCENLLEKSGALERLDSQHNMAAIKIDSELPTVVDLLPREAKVQRQVLSRLEQIVGPLRGERVFFKPQNLANSLNMKWTAVNRAIRELVKLEPIDFVPPFRGRAVHLLRRDQPFAQLNIDFAELERRKQSEYEKLHRMIGLATTRRCRQLDILVYFGDPDRSRCGICDNCRNTEHGGKPSGAHVVDPDACLYALQVALSGAARAEGRVGKTLIAQMLSGSAAKKVKQLSLHKLSTFGLLSRLRQSDVTQLLEWLLDHGYLDQIENTKFRPVVRISPSGQKLMWGESQPDLPNLLPPELITSLSIHLRGKTPVRPKSDREPLSAKP